MTKKEAIKVVEILLRADGGCPVCTAELTRYFILDFPKYKDLALSMFSCAFDEELQLSD